MVSVAREKIALIVFILLVFVGIGCLVAYINIGHSWNVTATTIDDATGELDGYTVVLFQGVVLDEEGDGGSEETVLDGDGLANSEETPFVTEISSEDGESSDLSDVSDEIGVEDSGSEESDISDATSLSGASNTGGSLPLFNSSSKFGASEEKEPVDVSDAADSYREKGASVLVLDLDDSAKYEEGTILKRGDRRFGVFSVSFNEPLPKVQAKIDYLKEQSVDFVVAITPDKRFVQKATGVDVVISSKSEGLFFMGETLDGTFYTDSPLVSQVGAVLISPHNVVSSRDISEL